MSGGCGRDLSQQLGAASRGTLHQEPAAERPDPVRRTIEPRPSRGIGPAGSVVTDAEPQAAFISPRFVDTSAGSGSRYKMFDMYWVRKSDR